MDEIQNLLSVKGIKALQASTLYGSGLVDLQAQISRNRGFTQFERSLFFYFFFEHKYIGHIYIRRKCEKVQKREEKNPLFFPCYAFARKQEIQDLFYPVLRAKPKGTNHGSYV